MPSVVSSIYDGALVPPERWKWTIFHPWLLSLSRCQMRVSSQRDVAGAPELLNEKEKMRYLGACRDPILDPICIPRHVLREANAHGDARVVGKDLVRQTRRGGW